jgi:tetratricopeptide (TPR) repeat protein
VKLKDTAAATTYFKKSIEIGPNIPDMYYFYGQYLCQNNRFSEAIPLLKKALEQSPGHIYSRYMLMNVYANNYMWDDLDALVAESIKLFPTDPEVLKFQDIAKNRKSVSEQAEAQVQSDKSPQGYVNLSLAYFNDKKYQECISACEEALKLDPANADAYNNMSCAYNQMGDWDNAQKNAELAVKYRPDFDVAVKNLASIKSRNESAYAQLAKVKANPTAQGYYEMSCTYFGGLDFKNCIVYANLALQMNPNDVNCYNNLTAAYSKQFMWAESEKANQQALKLDPTNKTALENQQYIQQHKGETR